MVDSTTLQNENSALKEQLEKANKSIQHLQTVEKTNLELVQKVSALEASVKALLKFMKKKLHDFIDMFYYLVGWEKAKRYKQYGARNEGSV